MRLIQLESETGQSAAGVYDPAAIRQNLLDATPPAAPAVPTVVAPPAAATSLAAEGSPLPTEGLTLSVSVEGSPLPTEGLTLSVEGSPLPTEGLTLSVEGSALPTAESTLPADGSSLRVAEAPLAGSPPPADESPRPAVASPPSAAAAPLPPPHAGKKFSFDQDFTRWIVRFLEPLMRVYFRAELRGAEHLPEQQTILVANHDGGMLPLDGIVIGSAWHQRYGFQKPMHVLVHDIVLRFAPWLRRVGAVLADRHNLDAIMEAGESVLVYPGASRETFRTFWERKQISLGNRTGFVKHALLRGVPITPVVSAGVHETFIVLWRGTWLAERLGFAKLFRADVFPIVAGLPFGIWLGAILPQLPLPAKITVQILPPIDVRAAAAQFLGRPLRDEDLDNNEVVDFCFRQIRDTMQKALDGLYAERRYPVLG